MIFFTERDSSKIIDGHYSKVIKSSSGCTSVTYTVNHSASIIITNPSSSTVVYPGSDLRVEWGSEGMSSEMLKIELYKGSVFEATLETSTINNGAEYCQIPEGLEDGTDYKIKITGLTSGEYDFSEEFTIESRKLFVYEPRRTDVLEPHTNYLIEWHSIGTKTKVKIDLYLNSKYLLEITSETEDDSYFTWNVWQGENLSTTTKSNYQIRIQKYNNSGYFGFSPRFIITNEKYIKILTPTVNSSYKAGQIMNIYWDTNSSSESVAIDLMKYGTKVLQINSSTDNTGSYEWKIPSYLKSDNNYYLFINTTDNSANANSKNFTLIGINSGIPGYSFPLLITGFILIGFCIFLLNRKKILSYRGQ